MLFWVQYQISIFFFAIFKSKTASLTEATYYDWFLSNEVINIFPSLPAEANLVKLWNGLIDHTGAVWWV